ncbi:MAG: DUF4270 family protein [Bacteroidia bacterium]
MALLLRIAVIFFFLSQCRNPRRIGAEILPPPQGERDTFALPALQNPISQARNTYRAPFVFIGSSVDSLSGRWESYWATAFSLGGYDVAFYNQELVGVDSAFLELSLVNRFGNAEDSVTFKVYLLQAPLPLDSASYDNTRTFAHTGQLVGQVGFRKSTFLPQVLKIPLDTSWAKNLLSAPGSYLLSDQAFWQYFPGFRVEAETSTQEGVMYVVATQVSTTRLRLHYREKIANRQVPQQYIFSLLSDTPWGMCFTRQSSFPNLRDSILHNQQPKAVLISGGLPADLRVFLPRLPYPKQLILQARLILPIDVARTASVSFPPPVTLLVYRDTIGEVSDALIAQSFLQDNRWIVDLTPLMQNEILSDTTRIHYLGISIIGRLYGLQRVVLKGLDSPEPPYLEVFTVLRPKP